MRINNVAVIIKILIILVFIGVGLFFIKPANYHPFLPFKMGGVMHGATTVFFAFLGFDAISSSAAEAKNPKKNMPLGIIGTLVIATILYMGVSVVLTGMVPYTKLLPTRSPVLKAVNQGWIADLLSIGALVGMFTMMVTMTYSSSRLVYSIGRDGLLPKFLSKLDEHSSTPQAALGSWPSSSPPWGGLVSLDQLTSLVNIGTLLRPSPSFPLGSSRCASARTSGTSGGFQVPWFPASYQSCLGSPAWL